MKAITNEKAMNVFGWLEWIIEENRELTFCEKVLTRKYTNLKTITVKTLKKYMESLVIAVENKIKQILPNKFGMMFDGWSEGKLKYFF